jgi:hypothetical protein
MLLGLVDKFELIDYIIESSEADPKATRHSIIKKYLREVGVLQLYGIRQLMHFEFDAVNPLTNEWSTYQYIPIWTGAGYGVRVRLDAKAKVIHSPLETPLDLSF